MRGVLYGLVAAVVYSGLAFWTNRDYAFALQIRAALLHGALCFAATFVSTNLMEFFFSFGTKTWAKYCRSLFFSGLVSGTIFISFHLWSGTPAPFATMFYSALTSLPYYFLFPLKLVFEYKKKMNANYRTDERLDNSWEVSSISTPYEAKELYQVLKHNVVYPKKENETGDENIEQQFHLNNITSRYKIGFLGDLMPMYKKKLVVSDEIKQFFNDVDYLVANFEGLYKQRGDKKFVFLSQNHDEQILEDLKTICPSDKIVLSLANNHGADFGYDTFKKTQEILKANGFQVIGGRSNESVLLENELQLVAATQWSNQSHGYLSFLEQAYKHHNPNAKFSMLYPHWGYEMEYWPRLTFKEQALKLLDQWDLIVGHHSHLPGLMRSYPHQGIEKLIAYSLGDTATGLPRRRYRFGMALKVEIGPNHHDRWCVGRGEWLYTHLSKDVPSCLSLNPISQQTYLDIRI